MNTGLKKGIRHSQKIVIIKNLPLAGLLFLVMFLSQTCTREEFKWGKKVGDLTYLGNTVILGPEELSSLTEYSDNKMLFSNQTGELGNISDKSYVVTGVSEKLPNGFLGKVENVEFKGSQVSISFTDATLTDVVKDGTIRFHEKLIEKNFKLKSKIDGVLVEGPDKSFDGIAITLDDFRIFNDGTEIARLDGSIGISPEIDISITIESGIVKEISLATTLNRIDEITVSSTGAFSGSEKKIAAEFVHLPIIIDNLVFVPEITIFCGFDGTVSSEISSGVRQDWALTSRLIYSDGNWMAEPIVHNESFDFMRPEVTDASDLKVISDMNVSLELFGKSVQTVYSSGYYSLIAEKTGNLLWKLLIGCDGTNSINSEILGLDSDFSTNLTIEPTEIGNGDFR